MRKCSNLLSVSVTFLNFNFNPMDSFISLKHCHKFKQNRIISDGFLQSSSWFNLKSQYMQPSKWQNLMNFLSYHSLVTHRYVTHSPSFFFFFFQHNYFSYFSTGLSIWPEGWRMYRPPDQTISFSYNSYLLTGFSSQEKAFSKADNWKEMAVFIFKNCIFHHRHPLMSFSFRIKSFHMNNRSYFVRNNVHRNAYILWEKPLLISLWVLLQYTAWVMFIANDNNHIALHYCKWLTCSQMMAAW